MDGSIFSLTITNRFIWLIFFTPLFTDTEVFVHKIYKKIMNVSVF